MHEDGSYKIITTIGKEVVEFDVGHFSGCSLMTSAKRGTGGCQMMTVEIVMCSDKQLHLVMILGGQKC